MQRTATVTEHRHAPDAFQMRDADHEELAAASIDFLEEHGSDSMLGEEFCALIEAGTGEERFAALLRASGHEDNAEGFFGRLRNELAGAHCSSISIGGIKMPNLYLLRILEKLLSGEGVVTITSVEQLEQVTNLRVPPAERQAMQEVIDRYPVRLSHHTLRQIRYSSAIAYQYLPFVDELDTNGLINTWVGQFHQGPLEQMYQNRPIFVMHMSCPTYCRFCFRKHKECRTQPSPTVEEIREGVRHLARQQKVKEVLLTGGDPFLNRATMNAAIEGISEIEHIRTLRLATRSISYYPAPFLGRDREWLRYLSRIKEDLQQRGKRLEVATHFLHPDELSYASLEIISELTRNGIAVYVQTPLLNQCNESGEELVELYNHLRRAGAEIHYIFMPCTPLQGNRRYVTSIATGLETAQHLRANLSDRAIPKMCTATAIGKIDWLTSGWAVEDSEDGFLWVRTPYTTEYFKEFCPGFSLEAFQHPGARENEEGTIDIQFLAKIGDTHLFRGGRRQATRPGTRSEQLPELQGVARAEQRREEGVSVAPGIRREHLTRAELDLDVEIDYAYLEKERQITDVILSAREGAFSHPALEESLRRLAEISHLAAIRLRSLDFTYEPERYTQEVIATLGQLSQTIGARLEIETQFLHPSEADERHQEIVNALNEQGITVYNNTPLLQGINDEEDCFERLANHLREAGIEFNTAYVAGTRIQERWQRPLAIGRALDLASHLRKHGSGREIPRYLLQTECGEVDFGLGTRFHQVGRRVRATLLPYRQADFPTTDAADGHPVVTINSLTFEDDFLRTTESGRGV